MIYQESLGKTCTYIYFNVTEGIKKLSNLPEVIYGRPLGKKGEGEVPIYITLG